MAHRDERPQGGPRVFVLCCVISATIVLLPACSSTPSGTAGPRLVTPKALGGSSGIGPRVIADAPAAPGGGTASQVVELTDRRLTIDAVTTPSAADPSTTVVEAKLAITNTGDAAIPNQAEFFQLVGSAGDAFAPRNDAADPFFAAIDARATRTGSLVFEIPGAAASNLHLLYRPELPTEAVVVPLSVR